MTESERDEFDRNFDRLWEHLQTSATAREREPFERLLRAAWRHQPWRRRLLRLGRAPRLPPLKAESADVVPSRPRHPSGYPIEGFFAATAEEVTDEVVEHGPGPEFAGVESKMMSPVEVANLGEILRAGAYQTLVDTMMDDDREAKHREAGAYRVEDAIRDALVETEELDTVAKAWAATDELVLDHWTEADALVVLNELQELARQARGEGKHLWVWWSL